MGQHRTPLRYPGGKQRLAPFIDELLVANECLNGHYVEPYAGGAGVAIELLLNDRVNRIHLNDSSVHIFSFWHSILCQTEKFCRHIFSASLTVDEWKRQRNIVQHPENHDEFEIGFSTFYLNRPLA